MHYHHAYHAGNFADVFKHTLLCGLLQALSRKDKPWSYLDTHAGTGLYDLAAAAALKTGEAASGIERLHGLPNPPEPLATLLRLVAAENPSGGYKRYPGSPLFAQALARPGDRLVLCDSVPAVVEELKATVDRGATVHLRDGYEAHALLPPPEKRGLVLVDPPFERRDEYEAMTEFVEKAQARFAGGVYALWYPMKNRHEAGRFRRRLGVVSCTPVVDFTLDTDAPAEGQMRGCGVAVVNPPYRFVEDMADALTVLARELSDGPHAVAEATWLKTE